MQIFESTFINNLETKYNGKEFSRPDIVSLATDPQRENERQRLEEWFKAIPEENCLMWHCITSLLFTTHTPIIHYLMTYSVTILNL
jgi:hypothetical protein